MSGTLINNAVPTPPARGTAVPTRQAEVTPQAADNAVVATAGTAVVVFNAGTIKNQAVIVNTHPTQPLFVDAVQMAGTLATSTTFMLPPGGTELFPPSTVAVTANSTLSGHSFFATKS